MTQTIKKNINKNFKPFIKWVWGKRQLLEKIRQFYPEYLEEHYPRFFNNYFEPFIWWWAVFFDLRNMYWKVFSGYIFDANQELINTYEIIKNNVEWLIKELKKYIYDKDFYLKIRSIDREQGFDKLSPIKKAARFIYLNRTSFNWLWRVNSKWQHNVPFGRYTNPLICDEQNLILSSEALQNTIIKNTDFSDVLNYARKWDFLYFDPPYDPISETANFTSYTWNGFGKEEQQRLADTFKELDKRWCFVMASNHNTKYINQLYKWYQINVVNAKRTINSNASKRWTVEEVVILNY